MGIFEPAANTMGWLMISQGRSRHVLHWGVINSTITVISFAMGLPWGPLGVAISFSLVGAFIRIPLLFWFACRVGPVRTADIYRTITVPLLTGVGVVGLLMLFRFLLKPANAFLGIVLCLLMAIVFALMVYFLTPQGRSGLADFQSMLRQAIGRRMRTELTRL
jgi:PST family polysaccharide transporter